MSKVEVRKSFLIWGAVFAVTLVFFAFPLLQGEKEKEASGDIGIKRISALLETLPLADTEIEYYKDGVVSVSARCTRNELFEFLEKKGIKSPVSSAFFPKNMSVALTARVEFSDDASGATVTPLEISINGKEIPKKLFRGIAQLKLDFESPLVYN